jgi:hypothetical protein
MHPTQAMNEDRELSGIVTHNGQILRQPMVQDAAQQDPLGGDPHVTWVGDGFAPQVALPCVWVGKARARVMA